MSRYSVLGPIPYFHCLVRREYTRNMVDGQGDYLEGIAVGILCIRGDSPSFQVILKEPRGGCAFTLPIQALVTRAALPVATVDVCPWDCFSDTFGVCELPALRRTPVRLLQDATMAEYRFTVAFTGTDLADDPEQRKLLHVVHREDGLIGAYPNNRLLFHDPALFGATCSEKPDFEALAQEFRAEGFSPYMADQQRLVLEPVRAMKSTYHDTFLGTAMSR
jgi:hypothetical protein